MKKAILIFVGVLVIVVLVSKGRDSAKLLFVGDMNFDRYARQVAEAKGEDFVFSCIGNVLKEADLVVGNLEGPITDKPSVSLGTKEGSPANYVFTFPPATAKLLERHNIKLVNLGNNHFDDFGKEGMLSTRDYLEKSGVSHFGGFGGDEPVYRTKLGGAKISFVSYNQFGGDSSEKVAEKISQENEDGRLVIVYAHWGEEYSPVTAGVKNIAKLFSKSGAGVVIGSHPHVVLPSEKITPSPSGRGDTVVYYSLGNFVFDQYWNPEVRTGLMLELVIKNGKIEIAERKVDIGLDGRTCLAVN